MSRRVLRVVRPFVLLTAIAALAVPPSASTALAGRPPAPSSTDSGHSATYLADPPTNSGSGDGGPELDPPPGSTGSGGSGTGL